MTTPTTLRVCGSLALLAAAAAPVPAYIHFPPATLPKPCEDSDHVRLLKVKAVGKDRGVIAFDVAEDLKPGRESPIASFRHALWPDAAGSKPVPDWAAEGKPAVTFSIEAPAIGCAYVFIDEYCNSVDYNARVKYWFFIRGEPGLSATYFGPADKLPALVKDVLAGKEVKVPVKAPEAKTDRDGRAKEVGRLLRENRGLKP